MKHKLAMIDGYVSPFGSFNESASPAQVEQLIRDQVGIMLNVQKTLWDAHSRWSAGQFWIGVVFPPAIVLQIGKYDWKDAVNSWQGAVDAWWGSKLTDAVRADPNAIGTDGQSRLQAWTSMGQHIIVWAQDIAKNMKDDDVRKLFSDYGDAFIFVLQKFKEGAGSIITSVIPEWVFWVAGAGAALYLLGPLLRRR